MIRLFVYASFLFLPFLLVNAIDKTAEQNENRATYWLCIGDGLPADECRAGVYGSDAE